MADPASAIGQPSIVDRNYILHEQLGEGGMGAVFRAIRRVDGRSVALKVISERGEADPTSQSATQSLIALAREFQTLSSLHHPNVIQVLDYGFDGEVGPYFTMELLSSPQDLLTAGAGKDLQAKVDLLTQLLRALAYLHRRGVIHRDLKPSNVLCVAGQVRVLDFGLATTDPNEQQVAGTIDYMAPELFARKPPSVRSDLYAFGVMAEQLLRDQRPRTDESRVKLQQAPTLNADSDEVQKWLVSPELPTLPTIESIARSSLQRTPSSARSKGHGRITEGKPIALEGLVALVERLCAPNPEDRFGSADEVLEELGRAIGVDLPIETEATRESFLQASEFVGRDAELAELRSALADATRGHGSAWLVGGESGVGKSRLLSELRTLALVQGAFVVQGQAVSEGSRSYEVWLPVLRSLCLRADPPEAEAAVLQELLPDLPDLLGRPLPDPPKLGPAAAQARLADAIDASFRRQVKPTVVILEDLHWAKEDSISLFDRIARLAVGLPLLLVGNYRDDEAPQLAASVAAARSMKLERLPRRQIARLSASMLGRAGEDPQLIEFLCAETEGNIFFLIEIVRALAEQAGQLDRIGHAPLPEHLVTGGIERIVRSRVERVRPADRSLLEVAATLGRKLDLGVLRTLAPEVDPAPWLVRCADAAILEIQGGEWRFSHDKLREAILAAIPEGERPALHGRVGRALEAFYTGADRDARSAALAHHFERSGDLAKASLYRARAGDLATRLCSYGDARRHFAAAIAALSELPPTAENRRLKIDALLKQVYTTMVADSTEQNMARMVEATALLDALAGGAPEDELPREDKLRRARVNNVIGRIHLYRGQSREAIAYFRRVLPIAEESGDDELLALPSCLIGTALLAQGNMRRAEPLLAQAAGPLERLGEPFEWFRAVGYHGFSLIALGRYKDGLAELERVHARAREIGQPSLSSAAHLMRCTALTLTGEWPRVLHDGQEVVRLASQTGDKLHLSLAWSNLGWANSSLGRHDEARACRARAVELEKVMGGRLIMSDWYVAADAELALNAGRVEEALEGAMAVAESSRGAELCLSHGIAERVWGAALARAGDAAGCDAHMKTSVEVLEDAGVVFQAARTRLAWALARHARGDVAMAEQLFEEALAVLTAAGCDYTLVEAVRRWYARGETEISPRETA